MKIEFKDGLWYCGIRSAGKVYLGFSPVRDQARQYAFELLAEAGENWHDLGD